MLTTIPGSAVSDSYVTMAEADAHHAARLHNAAWTSATEANKEAALKWAARIMNDLEWLGRKSDDKQALAWPRAGVVNWDGYLLDTDFIPTKIKTAQIEYAFLLLQSDRTAESGTEGFSMIQVGPIKLDINANDRSGRLSSEIYSIIREFLGSNLSMERG